VFDHTANNKDVFTRVGKDIVRSVVGGYNGTVFAYGQTAAGKTWTMHGDKANPGILPQSIVEIADAIAEVRLSISGGSLLHAPSLHPST